MLSGVECLVVGSGCLRVPLATPGQMAQVLDRRARGGSTIEMCFWLWAFWRMPNSSKAFVPRAHHVGPVPLRPSGDEPQVYCLNNIQVFRAAIDRTKYLDPQSFLWPSVASA